MRRLLLVVVCVLVARSATAAMIPIDETIVITSGSLSVLGLSSGKLDLVGGDRLTFTGTQGTGVVLPALCSPCAAGMAINPSAFWNGQEFLGVLTLDGVSYATNAPGNGGWARFTGLPLIVPAVIVGQSTLLLAPFQFESHVYLGSAQASITMLGQGVATLGLTGADLGGGPTPLVWWFTPALSHYDFSDPTVSAVPEPASVLLVGPALVGLWRRRHCTRTLVGATLTIGDGRTTKEKGSEAGPSPAGP